MKGGSTHQPAQLWQSWADRDGSLERLKLMAFRRAVCTRVPASSLEKSASGMYEAGSACAPGWVAGLCRTPTAAARRCTTDCRTAATQPSRACNRCRARAQGLHVLGA